MRRIRNVPAWELKPAAASANAITPCNYVQCTAIATCFAVTAYLAYGAVSYLVSLASEAVILAGL